MLWSNNTNYASTEINNKTPTVFHGLAFHPKYNVHIFLQQLINASLYLLCRVVLGMRKRNEMNAPD